jgi:PEP-CTERM motif
VSRRFLFLVVILLASSQIALAGSSVALNPPSPTNISVSSSCPPADCSFGFGVGTPAGGDIDFTPAGFPVTIGFETADPLSWSGAAPYVAMFGYGGFVDMTGPNGLTLTGVVTSGIAVGSGFGGIVVADFFGQWSDGQYATGEVQAQDIEGLISASVGVSDITVSEPGTVALFASGLLGLAASRRKLR